METQNGLAVIVAMLSHGKEEWCKNLKSDVGLTARQAKQVWKKMRDLINRISRQPNVNIDPALAKTGDEKKRNELIQQIIENRSEGDCFLRPEIQVALKSLYVRLGGRRNIMLLKARLVEVLPPDIATTWFERFIDEVMEDDDQKYLEEMVQACERAPVIHG